MCQSSFTMIRWAFLCSCCWPKLTSKKPHTAVLATAPYSIYFQDHGGMWPSHHKGDQEIFRNLKLPSLTKVFKLISWWTMKWIITFIHFIHNPLKASLKSTTLCCTSNWNYHQFPKPFAIVSFFGWNRTWNKMQDHTIFSHRNTRPETIPEGIIGIIFPILGARWKTGEAAWRLKFFAFSPVFCQSQLVKIRHKGLQFRVF